MLAVSRFPAGGPQIRTREPLGIPHIQGNYNLGNSILSSKGRGVSPYLCFSNWEQILRVAFHVLQWNGRAKRILDRWHVAVL